MSTHHLSLRIETSTYEQLESQSRQTGQSLSELARTLLEEGLRAQAHPGIVFRAGPAGRRPGLTGGPDVWEVARVLREVDASGDEVVQRTAELTGLTVPQVRTVLRYYAEYRDEIDDWIRRVDEEATRAEQASGREQDLLRR